MPLNFTAAYSSRISKRPQGRIPPLKCSSSSASTSRSRHKSGQRPRLAQHGRLNEEEEDVIDDHLEDLGLAKCLATDLNFRDVALLVQHACTQRFDSLPEAGGFDSSKISKILNFQRSLPPIVSVCHLHGVTPSPTTTEREISELIRAGTMRKIIIPGRNMGGSCIGEGVSLAADIERLVRNSHGVQPDLGERFLRDLRENPKASSLNCAPYTAEEISAIMQAGFLTAKSGINGSKNVSARSGSASDGTPVCIPNLSRAPSGSVAAVGGDDAIQNAGGRNGLRTQQTSVGGSSRGDLELQLTLPGMGPYLKMVTAARSHFISLIEKSSFREVPLYLLKERWEGGISADGPAAKAKKYRGEFAGVLPARTRKWKQFSGLSFNWVLAECLGAGLIELFETGSVGQAARLV